MSNVRFYLRTHRRKWGLSQREVASLLPKGDRNRVSDVERGKASPNAVEIVAYRLMFGASAQKAFPHFHAKVEDAVMQRAYRLHKRMEGRTAPLAQRKRELTEHMLARATGKVKRKGV